MTLSSGHERALPLSRRDGPLAAWGAALGAALVASLVYRRVLDSYFWNDDFGWLFLLHEKGLVEFLFTPMGGHSLVARNAVMALLDGVVGLDPGPWFASALLTHALNVALLARFVWLLTGSAALAGIGAIAWGTSPAASQPLAWYSVYGQVAATGLVLAAFNRIARLARDGAAPATRDLILVTVLLGLSSLFFGTAIPVAIAWPVAGALLVPDGVRGVRRAAGVVGVSVVVLGIYLVLQVIGLQVYYADEQGTRVLGWIGNRWWLIVEAFAQLLRVGTTSLVLGPWWKAGEHSDFVSWSVLALAMAGWATATWRASRRLRGALLASLVVALAIYAMIAVARGAAAGAIFLTSPAELAAIMRYHYAAQAFLVVASCAAFSTLPPRRGLATAGGWGLLLLVGHLVYGVDIDLHEASRQEVTGVLQRIRMGVAAAPEGETVYLRNHPISALGYIPNNKETPPGLAGLYVIAFPDDVLDGRTVRFIERRAPLRERAIARGGRTGTLLVPPQ